MVITDSGLLFWATLYIDVIMGEQYLQRHVAKNTRVLKTDLG